MNIEDFRNYCLSKKSVTEEFPFGPDTIVFKIGRKIFALAGLENVPFQINLKCDPERAIRLREEYDGLIKGAFHMDKKHWNSLIPGSLPPKLVLELIDHSYDLVVAKLPKKQQSEIKNSEEI